MGEDEGAVRLRDPHEFLTVLDHVQRTCVPHAERFSEMLLLPGELGSGIEIVGRDGWQMVSRYRPDRTAFGSKRLWEREFLAHTWGVAPLAARGSTPLALQRPP